MQTRNSGVALVIIGIVMMVYTGFNLVTTKTVVDVGPLQINKNENHPVQWSPIVGVLLIAGGIVLIAMNKNKKQ